MTAPGVIIIDPVLPIWLIVAIVGAVAYGAWRTYGACAVTARQRWVLWALRMGAVIVIAWLLLQARRRSTRVEEEFPALGLVVDVSASMTDNPGDLSHTRKDRAVEFLSSRRVESLSDRYRVVRYAIGAAVEEGLPDPADIRFNAPRSHLGSCINRIVDRYRAENLSALILLTDGLDQSGEHLSPQSLRIPMYVVELEEDVVTAEPELPDHWIADVSYPKMMAVNWRAGIDVLVRRRAGPATAFPIHLRESGRLLRSSMVEFADGDVFQQVTFAVEPVAVGQKLYRVEIAPDLDSDADNNTRDFLIEVTDPKNKVLYLEGVPRWEFKFLKRALLSEKNYQLSAYVRGGDGSFINFDEISGQAGGEAPAFTPEGLLDFKVIVIGDMGGSALEDADFQNIRAFVDRGGGLLFAGAHKAYGLDGLMGAAALRDLFPALSSPGAVMREGRFTVDITPGGRNHPALGELSLEGVLPPLLSFWGPVDVGEFSSVLIAAADGSPVVVTRRFGQGRVAMMLSDSLWRWQLGDVGGGAEKSLYNRFITQLVYWLAPSEKDLEQSGMVQLVTARSEVELRENVTVGAVYDVLAGDTVTLTCRVKTADGEVLVFPMLPGALGRDVGLSRSIDGYRCTFSPQQPGQYEVTVSTSDGSRSASMTILAAQPRREQTGDPIDRVYLRDLAEETGGQFVSWDERFRVLRELPYDAQEFTRTTEASIWDRWWWIGVLIILFCAEWWWRRKLDLI